MTPSGRALAISSRVGHGCGLLRVAAARTDHEHNGGADIRGHGGVEGHFGGVREAVVIRAEHEHRLILLAQLLIATHDLFLRLLRIGVHEIVGDAKRFLVGLANAWVRGEQLNGGVTVVARIDDRPEHGDGFRRGDEGFKEAEGNGGLAGASF